MMITYIHLQRGYVHDFAWNYIVNSAIEYSYIYILQNSSDYLAVRKLMQNWIRKNEWF